jgi:hypothetical protein
MTPPDFHSWSHTNLAKLAEEMYFELKALREDLKAAIKAYRELNTKEKENG